MDSTGALTFRIIRPQNGGSTCEEVCERVSLRRGSNRDNAASGRSREHTQSDGVS